MKRPKQQYNNEISSERMTDCICPKCGREHRMKLLWAGTGIPKKFCKSCCKSVFNDACDQVDYEIEVVFCEPRGAIGKRATVL